MCYIITYKPILTNAYLVCPFFLSMCVCVCVFIYIYIIIIYFIYLYIAKSHENNFKECKFKAF